MHKATILIVEDDAILAMVLQKMICQLGYAVAGPFAFGEEAIAFLPGSQVDLILMDIELAGDMNGVTTAEILLRTADIPVVFLSGFSQSELLAQAKTISPYGYLVKPVSDQALAATLEMSLHRHKVDMELKESRNALAKSEEKFRTVADHIYDWEYWRAADGSFVYISPSSERVTGYTPEEFYQDPGLLATIIHPDDQKKFAQHIEDVVKGAAKNDVQTLNLRIIHRGGKECYIEHICREVCNQDGILMGRRVTNRDITERKQAEEALRAYYRQTADIMASISDAFFSLDDNLVVTYFNAAAEKTLGKTADEVLGRPLFDVFPGARGSVFERNYRQAAQEKLAMSFDVNFNVAPYENWYEVRVYPQEKGISVYFQVVTERKRLEEEQKKLTAQLHQAQKMEAIGTLAGGIAHDFNNILGAILGYAEMVQEDSPAGSSIRKDIDQVVKASHRAKDLVKQILAFSRQDETALIPIQPAIIIKEAIKMLRSTLPTTIEIRQDIDAEAGLVLADPTQIHQVMVNLCANAFHAMEEKGGILTISLKSRTLAAEDLTHEPHVSPGRFVQLSIGDTGPGIAPEIREKIFDPYFTTKEVGKGTGMGLAIIHGLVKSYKGFTTCHSGVGEGAVFQVFLPVIEDPAVLEVETVPLDLSQLGNERILFIDDEEILAEMGQIVLERLGYRVTVRRSSLEALNTFQNHPEQFDLIITDQTMPGMTGSDLARRILQIRPGMPIILCTGYSSLITEDKAKSLGIKGFAMKPLAKKDIAAIIRKVLDEVR